VVLDAALDDSNAAGLPAINVTPAQGRLLALLIRVMGARRVLEIGTLGGYSTIWMARELPDDGMLVTLEISASNASVAQRNIERAGLARRTTILVAPASESLNRLMADRTAPFDFVFIDADKPSNTIYLDWAIRLGRPGTVIVLDNVVRDGQLVNGESRDPNVLGSRGAFDLIAANPRLSATALQTVGGKGYDGFAVMIVD
jgi:predicted O-methyltransferase YrrM